MNTLRKSLDQSAANNVHHLAHHLGAGMDKVRKSFEKWASNEGHPVVRRADGSYVYADVERDWHIWRTAIMYNGTPN